MHRYYRYLNSFSRMIVLPKGRNQMNVLRESRILLLLLAPNSLARINVFDMICEEILCDSWSPLKGCLNAPFIMKMIKVVTETRFEKPAKHSRYVSYWVDSINPATRSKRAPIGSGGPTSSDEPSPQSPHHETSSRTAAASRPMDRSGRGRGQVEGTVSVGACLCVWQRASLASSPCATAWQSRSLCTGARLRCCMRTFIITLPPWVIPCLRTLLCLQPLPTLRTLMSGTNKSMMCHLLPLRMRPRSLMTPIHRLLLPTRVRDPFPVNPGRPALATFILLPIQVRDQFLVIPGLPALVTITILLLHTRVLHLHQVFLLEMSPRRNHHSGKI
jgi:hypothetical protein